MELTQGQQVKAADGRIYELRKPVASGQFWSGWNCIETAWGLVRTNGTTLLANSEIVAVKATATEAAEAAAIAI